MAFSEIFTSERLLTELLYLIYNLICISSYAETSFTHASDLRPSHSFREQQQQQQRSPTVASVSYRVFNEAGAAAINPEDDIRQQWRQQQLNSVNAAASLPTDEVDSYQCHVINGYVSEQ